MHAQALPDRQDTSTPKPVSGKVWETEGSSPREVMAATQQSAAVVSESHQLLLVSMVREGNSQVTQAGTKQEVGRNIQVQGRKLTKLPPQTPKPSNPPHSCVIRAVQIQSCKLPSQGILGKGFLALLALTVPGVKASLDQSSQLSGDVMSGLPAQGCLDLDKHYQHSPGWQQSHQEHRKSKHRETSASLPFSTLSTLTAHNVTSAN